MNEIVSVINGVGFPIACCIALFWFNREMLNNQSKMMQEFKDAIHQNTCAITQLTTKIGKE